MIHKKIPTQDLGGGGGDILRSIHRHLSTQLMTSHHALRINLAIAQAMLALQASSSPEGQSIYKDAQGNERSHWYDALGRFVGGPSSPEAAGEVADKQIAKLGQSFNVIEKLDNFGDSLRNSALEAIFSIIANPSQKKQKKNWEKLEAGKFTEEDYTTKEGLMAMKKEYSHVLQEEKKMRNRYPDFEDPKSMADAFRDSILQDTVSTFLDPGKLAKKGFKGVGNAISEAISSVAKMTEDANVGDMAYLAGFALITAGTMAVGGYVAAAGIAGLSAIAGGRMAATGANIGVNGLRAVVGGAVATMNAARIPEFAKAFRIHASKEDWETKQAVWDTLDLQLRDSFAPFIEDKTREARGKGELLSTLNSKSSAREISDGLAAVITAEKVNSFLRLDDPPDDLPEEEKQQMLKERLEIGQDVGMYFALLVMKGDGDSTIDNSPRGIARRKQMKELSEKIGAYYGKLGREMDKESMIQELKKHGKMPNGESYRMAITSAHEINLRELKARKERNEVRAKYQRELNNALDEMNSLENRGRGTRETATVKADLTRIKLTLEEIASDPRSAHTPGISKKLESAQDKLDWLQRRWSINRDYED